MSFLFKKKDKPVRPPSLPLAPQPKEKVKTAEEAKREALQKEKEELERAKDVQQEDDDESQRKRASRRISQTQFGKPLSYNAYLSQNIAGKKN